MKFAIIVGCICQGFADFGDFGTFDPSELVDDVVKRTPSTSEFARLAKACKTLVDELKELDNFEKDTCHPWFDHYLTMDPPLIPETYRKQLVEPKSKKKVETKSKKKQDAEKFQTTITCHVVYHRLGHSNIPYFHEIKRQKMLNHYHVLAARVGTMMYSHGLDAKELNVLNNQFLKLSANYISESTALNQDEFETTHISKQGKKMVKTQVRKKTCRKEDQNAASVEQIKSKFRQLKELDPVNYKGNPHVFNDVQDMLKQKKSKVMTSVPEDMANTLTFRPLRSTTKNKILVKFSFPTVVEL